jgi:hypothetical protein
MNVEKIDQILSDALHALGSAQAELRKNASARDLGDILRKVDDFPRASADDPHARLLDMLADTERRMERLEVAKDLAAQPAPRKTVVL